VRDAATTLVVPTAIELAGGARGGLGWRGVVNEADHEPPGRKS